MGLARKFKPQASDAKNDFRFVSIELVDGGSSRQGGGALAARVGGVSD